MATAVVETPAAQHEDINPLLHAIIVVIVGMAAIQLAEPQALPRIPLQNLLKNQLHVSRTLNSAFIFWILLPWYFKPFAGIVTDAFPLFGSRRKSYILGSTVLTALFWIVLYFTPHRYGPLLWVVLIGDIFMVIASTVVGGYMVEVAQRTAGTGRFSSAFNIVSWGAMMVSGPIGGYVASKPFGYMPFISAGIMFLLIPITLLFLREKKSQVNSHDLLKNAGKQLVNIGTAGTMWAVTGLMALFYIAPAASTAIFYRQQDLLHLDTQGQGYLVFLGGLGSVLSAILYGLVCKRINLRNLLFICLASATIANLGYLFYTTVGHARAVETINGFGFSLAECALIDLAMRAIPKGSEGLGFALMMSVRNFALFGSDIFGSWLLDKRNWTFSALIISNSATTIIVLPLLLFLPTVMLLRKDAERAST